MNRGRVGSTRSRSAVGIPAVPISSGATVMWAFMTEAINQAVYRAVSTRGLGESDGLAQ